MTAVTAELIFTGWICRCDMRGGRLTVILCGIWCVVMLITALLHLHLSKFITAWWDTPLRPPSSSNLHLIYLSSAPPPHLFCFRCNTEQQRCWCDLCSLPPILSVKIHHFIHVSCAVSIHLSLSSGFICLYMERKMWYEEEMELRAVWYWSQQPTVTHNLSQCTYPFPPLSLCVSRVDLVRGACYMRISSCWCYLVVLIATSHPFCTAEFVMSWFALSLFCLF